jgi:hypothetical protein
MGDDEESGEKDRLVGSFVNKTMNSVTGSLAESASASSLASGVGVLEQATKIEGDVAINVCKRNLEGMAAQQSIVNTRDVRQSGNLSVTMSPAIVGMVEACSLTRLVALLCLVKAQLGLCALQQTKERNMLRST